MPMSRSQASAFLSSPAAVATVAAAPQRARVGGRLHVHAPQHHQHQHQPHTHTSSGPHHVNVLAASTASAGHVNALKCPELLLRGVELHAKVPLERLEKKGKRFESPWHEYHVALYAGVLFYFDDLHELPRGIVPLAGCAVKAVDRIFKNSDPVAAADAEAASAEHCGPCFKVTSSAHRVLLFRCDSDFTRNRWIHEIQSLSGGGISASASALGSTTSSHASARSHASSEDAATLQAAARSRSQSPSRTVPNRFSLDETQIRRTRSRRSVPPGSNGSTTSTDGDATSANEPVAADTEVSQMLRDAMAMVRKQKLEILELRRALEEARNAARTSSIATRPSDADDIHALPTTVAPPSNESIPEADELVIATSTTSRIPTVPTEATEPEPAAVLTPPPQAAIDPVTVIAPLATETNTTDYLQKQAMELAEIARYLQLTFQNDVLASTKQFNSANSSSPTEMLDHISSTSSNYSDQVSEIDDEDSDGERLSEFQESDAKFLESNGMLDSIQKVMRDFSIPSSVTRAKSEQFIINDDIIAEITQGVSSDKKRDAFNLMDSNTLRSLRSQSACDETTDYKMSLSPKSIARTHSAREFSIDDFSSPALTSKQRKRLPKDLGHLVVEDNMALVSSILQTASRDDKTALLLPLVRVFHRHNRLSRLIRWAIESEVASVMNVATLFRSDDYASRLVSTYSKSVGSDFIKVTLTNPIQEIYKLKLADVDLSPTSYEEDPTSEVIQRNAENLMNVCQIVLDSIFANKGSIPSSYFHICSHLNAKVINRFDGSMEGLAVEDPASLTRSVIGGFLFLRFVCPAIATPHVHELVDKQPEPETRKILVLVTKLLFKTATSVLFNEKEAHLRVLNPFIERNSPAIQQLFYELAIPPAESINESFASDSQSMFSDLSPDQPEVDIGVIRAIATKNFDEIEKKLSVSGCSPTTVENLRVSLEAARSEDASLAPKGLRSKKLNMKFLSSFSKIVRKQSDV